MVKAVVLSNSLNNHKVSWLKSKREGLGKIEKSRWCSGGVVVVLWCWKPEGRGSTPGWAASSFTLVSEWKKPIR